MCYYTVMDWELSIVTFRWVCKVFDIKHPRSRGILPQRIHKISPFITLYQINQICIVFLSRIEILLIPKPQRGERCQDNFANWVLVLLTKYLHTLMSFDVQLRFLLNSETPGRRGSGRCSFLRRSRSRRCADRPLGTSGCTVLAYSTVATCYQGLL